MTKSKFLEQAKAAAIAASRESGLPPGVTVAQAALESNWGNSRLSREANNYFGIKAHGAHEWIELPTTEFRNGIAVRTAARFTRYMSMEACFADRDRLILTAPCYAQARACREEAEKFVRALAAHWATDPQYADKLLSIHARESLAAFDEQDTILEEK